MQVMLWDYMGLFLWPTGLRPHYSLSPGLLDPTSSPPALLGVSASLLCLLVLPLACCPPLALLPLACYAAAFLPALGLLQHGMIQRGGDRYAYLPYLPLAVGVAHLILIPVLEPYSMEEAGSEVVMRAEETNGADEVLNSSLPSGAAAAPPVKPAARCQAIRPCVARKVLVRALAVGVWAMVLARLSVRQLWLWRSDETMLEASLSLDTRDWRMVDLKAEHLLKHGRMEEARPLLERTLQEAPAYANPAKLALGRGKNLVLLGEWGQEDRRRGGCERFEWCDTDLTGVCECRPECRGV